MQARESTSKELIIMKNEELAEIGYQAFVEELDDDLDEWRELSDEMKSAWIMAVIAVREADE